MNEQCVCDYEISGALEWGGQDYKNTTATKKCETHSVPLKGGTKSCWVISSAWRAQAMLLPPPPAASTGPLRCPNVRPLLCFNIWYRSPWRQALALFLIRRGWECRHLSLVPALPQLLLLDIARFARWPEIFNVPNLESSTSSSEPSIFLMGYEEICTYRSGVSWFLGHFHSNRWKTNIQLYNVSSSSSIKQHILASIPHCPLHTTQIF